MFFDKINGEEMRVKNICFSSATMPSGLQVTLESEMDKRSGKTFGPPGGKKMTVFMDDLSMPEKNVWGDQPTLEFIRQLVETSGFCFLDKDKRGDLKQIEDLQYISAMGHPGGGRQDVPNRLKRHFFVFNMILPSNQTINEIYGQMLKGRFSGVGAYFQEIIKHLPNTTVALWTFMRVKMLPSPTKFHYTFNLRDLARVFQGVLRTPRSSIPDTQVFMKLWRHECMRVFEDKLTNDKDKLMFTEQLDLDTQNLLTKCDTPQMRSAISAKPISTKGGKFSKGPSTLDSAGGVTKDVLVTLADIQEECFFVDFLRDDEYDEDGVMVNEAPKIYELGESHGVPAHACAWTSWPTTTRHTLHAR